MQHQRVALYDCTPLKTTPQICAAACYSPAFIVYDGSMTLNEGVGNDELYVSMLMFSI